MVVGKGEGLDFFPGKWKITRGQTGSEFALVEVNDTVTRETKPHKHTREDEAWYVIDGELSFEVGEQKATAGPGTFVYAPRNIPHSFNVTKVPARYLIFLSPAGLESFFAEMTEVRKKYRQGSSEFKNQRNEISAKYGLVFLENEEEKSP